MKTKYAAYIFTLGLVVGSTASAEDGVVRLGDDQSEVYQVLGEPRGYVAYDDKELLFYERGRLELSEGRVSKVDLMSAEEFEAMQARREAALRQAQRDAQERQARLFVEGSALLERKLADEAFMTSPARERVSYWQAFQARYPNVPIGPAYETALQELEQDLALQAERAYQQERLASLERRVREAEERVRRAEIEARDARSYRTYYYATPVYSVPYSTYSGRYAHRARTCDKPVKHRTAPLSSSFVRNARKAARPDIRAHRYSGSPHRTGKAHYRSHSTGVRLGTCGSGIAGRAHISF